jgi:hypothetical protein
VSHPNSTAHAIAKYWGLKNNYVNTAYIIDKAGIVYKLYDDEYWAWHLGIKEKCFIKLRNY